MKIQPHSTEPANYTGSNTTVSKYTLVDRVPTLEELREILDAADIRGKALTLVLVSSGIREGGTMIIRFLKFLQAN
jgi:hypothetical protein